MKRNKIIMFGLLTAATMGVAYLIAKRLDDRSNYKTPKGKNRNRYK